MSVGAGSIRRAAGTVNAAKKDKAEEVRQEEAVNLAEEVKTEEAVKNTVAKKEASSGKAKKPGGKPGKKSGKKQISEKSEKKTVSEKGKKQASGTVKKSGSQYEAYGIGQSLPTWLL